jgi:hypothetical protein
MRTLISTLGFLAVLANALNCEQNYVIAQHLAQTNDDLSQAYTDLVNIVNGNLNTDCIASTDTPDFQPLSGCYTTSEYPFQQYSGQVFQVIARTEFFCGFRLWRTHKGCDLADQLDKAFVNSNFQYGANLWWVNATQPVGDCHCA